jgi:CheY-like chemotaxis protein
MEKEQFDGRLVLVVEQDRNVRDLQFYFLTRAGFRVEFKDDGHTAFAFARHTRPALVITEILVPKCDGLTLCRQLRDDPSTRDVPVIIFSILAAAPRAAEAGARAFLRKPLVETTFLATVEAALKARSSALMEQK